MRSTAFVKITAVYGQIDENWEFVRKMRFDYGQMLQKWLFVRKIRVKSRCTAQNKKNSRHHGNDFNHYSVAYGLMTARFHTLS